MYLFDSELFPEEAAPVACLTNVFGLRGCGGRLRWRWHTKAPQRVARTLPESVAPFTVNCAEEEKETQHLRLFNEIRWFPFRRPAWKEKNNTVTNFVSEATGTHKYPLLQEVRLEPLVKYSYHDLLSKWFHQHEMDRSYLYCEELEGPPRLPRRDCVGWGGKERPSRGVLPGPNIPDNPLLKRQRTVTINISYSIWCAVSQTMMHFKCFCEWFKWNVQMF